MAATDAELDRLANSLKKDAATLISEHPDLDDDPTLDPSMLRDLLLDEADQILGDDLRELWGGLDAEEQSEVLSRAFPDMRVYVDEDAPVTEKPISLGPVGSIFASDFDMTTGLKQEQALTKLWRNLQAANSQENTKKASRYASSLNQWLKRGNCPPPHVTMDEAKAEIRYAKLLIAEKR